MAFTDALTVVAGNPTKASEYNNLADNTEFNREKAAVEHNFAISGGDGTHTAITCTSVTSTGDIIISGSAGIVVGNASQIATNVTAELQVLGTTSGDTVLTVGRWSADATGPDIQLLKSRHGTIGSKTTVNDNDSLGTITWYADDGTEFDTPGAQIAVEVDGTPASDSIASRLVFLTNQGAAGVTEAMRIDSGGVVLIGTADAVTTNTAPKLQVLGDAGADAYILLGRWTADVTAPEFQFLKSRNTTINSHTIVQDGDRIGAISFRADDGVDYVTQVAQILVEIDDTPGADDMPGRIVFSTTAPGDNTVTEALRIDSGQRLVVGDTDAVTTNTAPKLQVLGDAGADAYILLGRWTADVTAPEFQFLKSRNTTIGSFTKVEENDRIGAISFRADDGADYVTQVAQILVEADGPTAADDMPGRMIFSTTADGASTVTERMRIDSSGNVGIGVTAFGTDAAKVIGISADGTVPSTSPAGMIQIFADDSSVGAANATLALRTEQAVEAIGTFTASHKLRIWHNGVEYHIQLDAV